MAVNDSAFAYWSALVDHKVQTIPVQAGTGGEKNCWTVDCVWCCSVELSNGVASGDGGGELGRVPGLCLLDGATFGGGWEEYRLCICCCVDGGC